MIQPDLPPPLPDQAAKNKIMIFAAVGGGAMAIFGLLIFLVAVLILVLPEWTTEQSASQTDEQSTESANEPPNEPAKKSVTDTIGMMFSLIPAGTFMMGSPEGEIDSFDDEHQHKVTISRAFYMQTTVVTQGHWKAVMGTEPWQGQEDSEDIKIGAGYPAMYVSWDDAVAYCHKMSAREGKTYRLPTEAEWEYACRAGTETRWGCGNDQNELDDYAWYDGNTLDLDSDIDEDYAHQVRLKKPNAFGLYDMHGNVYEWCSDYYGVDYYSQSPEQDPKGPAEGSSRVLRGGAWIDELEFTRSAYREAEEADLSGNGVGFRVVRVLDDSSQNPPPATNPFGGDKPTTTNPFGGDKPPTENNNPFK
jgi:formylglycine-generating enzyme required for sulfatase activity